MRDLGFADLNSYLATRQAQGATAHQVRVELGCGGSVAARLLTKDLHSGRDASAPRGDDVPVSVSIDADEPTHAAVAVGSVTAQTTTRGVDETPDRAPGRQQ